jgi:hypothetical protein
MTATIDLRPLRCGGCGALLPLGYGKTAACAYCKAETPIPAEYAALQRTAKGFADDREVARALYAKIGAPPGRLARALAEGFEGTAGALYRVVQGIAFVLAMNVFIGLVPLAALAYVCAYPVAKLIRAFAAIVASPIEGSLPAALVLPITLILDVPLFAVPLIAIRKEREMAEVRRDVHASLAAASPEHAGGPSLCRACGAALDVPAGALGVPCTYCRAENLVALPAEWVAHVRSREWNQFLRVDAAREAYRLASERASSRGWTVAFWFVLALLASVFVGVQIDNANIRPF